MRTWTWPFLVLLVLALALGIMIACGDDDDDDDDDDDACDVSDICSYVMAECPEGWGWTDLDLCVEQFLMDCANEADYLLCACACMAAAETCDDFGEGCEYGCWEDYCY